MSSSDKKTLGLKRFKKNGLDTVWSTVSTCIFESNQNRSVIGRYDGTSFTSFDEETLRLCKEYNHKYDKNILLGINDEQSEESEETDESEEETVVSEDTSITNNTDTDAGVEVEVEVEVEAGVEVVEVEKIEAISSGKDESDQSIPLQMCGGKIDNVKIQLDQVVLDVNDFVDTLKVKLQTLEKTISELNLKLKEKDEENTTLTTKCKKLQSAITAML
jgi:hypothetical protein